MRSGTVARIALSSACCWSAGRSVAAAEPPSARRPWGRESTAADLSVRFSYLPNVISLGVAARGAVFVGRGVSLGFGLQNTAFFYRADLDGRFPGFTDGLPRQMFELTPQAQWLFVRRRRFAPYVRGGLGLSILDRDGRLLGHWMAGPGVYIGVGGPWFLDLGVGFSGRFPVGSCHEAFTDPDFPDAPYVGGGCAFTWGPRVGLSAAFGAR